MNKACCIQHKHWTNTLGKRGISNVCSICCSDFKKCKGKLLKMTRRVRPLPINKRKGERIKLTLDQLTLINKLNNLKVSSSIFNTIVPFSLSLTAILWLIASSMKIQEHNSYVYIFGTLGLIIAVVEFMKRKKTLIKIKEIKDRLGLL